MSIIQQNYLNYKDNKKRLKYFNFEILNIFLKSCFFDKRLLFKSRLVLKNKIYNKNYNKYSIAKIKNRCILTGRNRFILKNFNLSRMCIREKISNGFFSGYKKI